MADSPKSPTKRQLKKIVKTQESLLKKEPENLVARVKLAGALKDLGRLDEALEHYHRVAQAYATAGRKVQALAVCRSVLDFAPDDSVSLSMLEELEAPAEQAPLEQGTAGVRPGAVPPAPAPPEGAVGAAAAVPPPREDEAVTADVVVEDQERPLHKGDVVSPPMEVDRPVREGTPNSVSVVTDFGGAAGSVPFRLQDQGPRPGGAQARARQHHRADPHREATGAAPVQAPPGNPQGPGASADGNGGEWGGR